MGVLLSQDTCISAELMTQLSRSGTSLLGGFPASSDATTPPDIDGLLLSACKLSFNRSAISTNSPCWILTTIFAGIAGRPSPRTKGEVVASSLSLEVFLLVLLLLLWCTWGRHNLSPPGILQYPQLFLPASLYLDKRVGEAKHMLTPITRQQFTRLYK